MLCQQLRCSHTEERTCAEARSLKCIRAYAKAALRPSCHCNESTIICPARKQLRTYRVDDV